MARVVIPFEDRAPVSEAWGAAAALRLLTSRPQARRRALVIGDNLGVVRFGAGTGRLHHARLQSPVEAELSQALLQGWRLRWVVVRRGFNEAADAEATLARVRAARLRNLGRRAAEWWIEWL